MKKQYFKTIPIQQADRTYNVYEKKDKYVKYGMDNRFPYLVIDAYQNSSIHASCVNAITNAIVGDGLITENNLILDQANLDGETWNEIFNKVVTDFYIFGAFGLEIIWSKDRSKIAEVYHIDFSYLRAKEKNLRGKIPGYFISNEWNKLSFIQEIAEIPFLPVFNPNTKKDEPNQIYVYQPYNPTLEYYPLPTYNACIDLALLDSSVDKFHLANIKNGMAPSIAITTFSNANEDDRAATEMALQNQYAGEYNAGRVLYMDVDSPENAPKIETIDLNVADGYYEIINASTRDKILTGHRITSPEILGIMTPGKLGGKDDVSNAYLLFLNTVIKPYQQQILDCMTKIMDINYPGIKLGIMQTKLFDDGTEETSVTTGADAENNEGAVLETQIEVADRIDTNQEDNNI
jgi:hypothetical protein